MYKQQNKIIHNLSPLSVSECFTFYNPPAASRTPMPIIQKPRKATQKYLSSFLFRGVDAWNSLPPAIRTLDSLPKFKQALKNIDLTRFLIGHFN